MKNILILLRPCQWLKNIFIFLPLFFSKYLFTVDYLYPAIVAFISYCFAASSIYCFNDIYDVESDKLHPKKCMRPIASGMISKKKGYVIMIVLFVISMLVLLMLSLERRLYVAVVIIFYYLLNVAYCIRLKKVVIVDVLVISLGFVLRLLVGGFATGIWVSHWIIFMTFLLALFLAFAKRRDDVIIYLETGNLLRKNINKYNLDFMNQVISIIASVVMICYIMYTLSEEVIERMGTSYLYITSIFVLAGILRYLQLTTVDIKSGSPTTVLMKDLFVKICVIGWIFSYILILYII